LLRQRLCRVADGRAITGAHAHRPTHRTAAAGSELRDIVETVVVTGISGNLGQRLAQQLAGWRIVGIDFASPPADVKLARFERLDLGTEDSCETMVRLFA